MGEKKREKKRQKRQKKYLTLTLRPFVRLTAWTTTVLPIGHLESGAQLHRATISAADQ